MIENNRKYSNTICFFIAIIGCVAYISLMFNNNLWMDEAFSAVLVKGSFSQVMERSAADTLPPLYNILNFLFTSIFGFHAWSLRLASVLPMIACLLISATVIRKHFGALTSSIYSLCLISMPQFLYYGLEIRMYALGLMFVTISGISTILIVQKIFENREIPLPYYICIILGVIGAGYTHHFAFVSSGLLFLPLILFSFIKKSNTHKYLLNILICIVCTIVLYIPCLITTLKQMKRVSGYFTMPDMSVGFIISCFKLPFITKLTPLSLLLILLFLITFIYALIGLDKSFSKPSIGLMSILLIDVYLDTLIFGVLATKILNSNIFTDRYLVPSLGLFWLGFALSLSQLCQNTEKKVFRTAAICFLLILTLWSYVMQFKEEYKPGVNEMVTYFTENVAPNDSYIIYEDNYQIEICFRYYFPNFHKVDDPKDANPAGHLYYLYVPGFEDKQKEILSSYANPEEIKDFSFDRYKFTLYKLY